MITAHLEGTLTLGSRKDHVVVALVLLPTARENQIQIARKHVLVTLARRVDVSGNYLIGPIE